ncbi:hypothetical protein L6452_17358 [Arctium lappa]|uniref:Uncharacterized protein n=1 Tax=Arctium lappa TaxID=4217 RepID=A0ACB9C321_ARCLA|nr:hypothetical protein L6452_17358 [Arctium lappa]
MMVESREETVVGVGFALVGFSPTLFKVALAFQIIYFIKHLRRKPIKYIYTMSSTSRAWMVAGTVGLVEGLKDHGFARWNYAIRTLHHHAKSNLRSISHTKNLSSPAAMASSRGMEEKINKSEESLRRVMYLSCWGPN